MWLSPMVSHSKYDLQMMVFSTSFHLCFGHLEAWKHDDGIDQQVLAEAQRPESHAEDGTPMGKWQKHIYI